MLDDDAPLYVHWQMGPKGPYATVLRRRTEIALTDFEKRVKIGSALLVAAEHREMPIATLAGLYPCPLIAMEPYEGTATQVARYTELLGGMTFPSDQPKRVAQPPKPPAPVVGPQQ